MTLTHTLALESPLSNIVVVLIRSDINIAHISFEKMIVYNHNIMKSYFTHPD